MLASFKISQAKNYVLMQLEGSGALEPGAYEYMKRVSGMPRHLEYAIEMQKRNFCRTKYEAVAALFAKLAYYCRNSAESKENEQLWIGAAQVSLAVAGFKPLDADITVTRLLRMHADSDTVIPKNWEG